MTLLGVGVEAGVFLNAAAAAVELLSRAVLQLSRMGRRKVPASVVPQRAVVAWVPDPLVVESWRGVAVPGYQMDAKLEVESGTCHWLQRYWKKMFHF